MPIIPCLLKKKKKQTKTPHTQIILARLHRLVLIIQLQDPSRPNLYNDLTLSPPKDRISLYLYWLEHRFFWIMLRAFTVSLLEALPALHSRGAHHLFLFLLPSYSPKQLIGLFSASKESMARNPLNLWVDQIHCEVRVHISVVAF